MTDLLLRGLQRSGLPPIANWAKEKDLTNLCAGMLRAYALRDYKPLGFLTKMSFAPDGVADPENSPLRSPGRDTTIRWEANTAPLLAESHGRLLLPLPMGVLPPTVDREHPTVGGHWVSRPDGRIWQSADVLYDDHSQVSAPHPTDPEKGFTPNPSYPYMSVKEADPRRMISQMHEDGVTPLVAGQEIQLGTNGQRFVFFLCQPVIQMTIKAHADGKRSSVLRIDVQGDRQGRHMALLYPLLDPPALTSAPGFLVYGDWRMNSREDGN